MERRKLRDEEDARAAIAAQKASGMSAPQWCRGAGIDGRSLRAWTINLERGAASAKSAKPVRVSKRIQLVELIPAKPVRGAARYSVRMGAHCIEVDDEFSEVTLRRLIKVLTSC